MDFAWYSFEYGFKRRRSYFSKNSKNFLFKNSSSFTLERQKCSKRRKFVTLNPYKFPLEYQTYNKFIKHYM